MRVLDIAEAESRFEELVEQVILGETVIVGRAGKPLAKLVPFSHQVAPRTPGALRGQIRIADDFDVLPEEWRTDS